MSRIGHGILETSYTLEDGEDFFGNELNAAELITAYQKHCEDNRDNIIAWLNNVFPRKEKIVKDKKGAKPKKEPVELTDSFEAGLVHDEDGRVF
jgi:hypothetical protein